MAQRRIAALIGLLINICVIAPSVSAQGPYAVTDAFGYTGTIYRYNSLADALAGTNAVSGSPFAVPQRDLSIYVGGGNPLALGTYGNAAIVLTNWSANGTHAPTPSNQNTGFVQVYDDEGGSVTSVYGAWTNDAMTAFHFELTGGNSLPGCTSPGDCGRLWNAGSPLGDQETTGGNFYSYDLTFDVSGLVAATYDPADLVYEDDNPVSQPLSVNGTFSGVFQNTSTDDPGSNGWYTFNLALDDETWVNDNGYGDDSYFGSAIVTPEPGTLGMLALGLVGLVGVRRRKGIR